MSSNLFKRGVTFLKEEDTRIIDSNALMAKKTVKLAPQPADEEGFSKGLSADVLDVLTQDTEEEKSAGEGPSAEPEGPSAEELRKQALLEIKKQKEEAEAALLVERQRVLEEAKKQGYQDGFAKGMQEVDAQKKQLFDREKELKQSYEEQVARLEPDFVETLTGIYEHIFHVDLSDYKDIVVYLISDTLRKTEGGRDYIIHVSKEDYPYVSMQKKQIAEGGVSSNSSIEIVEDITLSKNQALIETEGGIFDCSLGAQLSELGRRLRLLSYEGPEEE